MDAHDVYDHWEELKKAASRMKLIDQFLYDDKMLRDQELSFDEKPF
jgi:orotate phosphoribosyltransferase-like protein